jgi:hypothetical protein
LYPRVSKKGYYLVEVFELKRLDVDVVYKDAYFYAYAQMLNKFGR